MKKPKAEVGTYFLLSRNIFDSAIWRDDPHILKLFVYLLGNARHSNTPKKYPHVVIKRGEIVRSLSQISEDNEYLCNNSIKRWSRGKVSRMLKMLEKQEYISIASDTYGTHLSITNYDTYQTPNNYTSNTSDTASNTSDTARGINKNEYNGKNEKKITTTDVFNYFISKKNLTSHKEFTTEMKNAIDVAKKRGGYSNSDLLVLVDRHSDIVEATKDNGQYSVKRRSLIQFFGQKVSGGTSLICSEYSDEGDKWIRYKDGNVQTNEEVKSFG